MSLEGLPTTNRFHAAVYDWLLHEGTVKCFYGSTDYNAVLHLAACGIDLAKSKRVAEGRIPTFADTYSEPDEREAIVGQATCNCGQEFTLEHPPIRVGELMSKVAAHENAKPIEVLEPGPFGRVMFKTDHGFLPLELTPGPKGEPTVTWRGAQGLAMTWADAVRLLGEPLPR